MNAKIETAIKILGAQGKSAESFMRMGKEWFQIDCRERLVPRFGGGNVTVSFGPLMLATPKEMEELADGVYTLDELKELFLKRRADKKAGR